MAPKAKFNPDDPTTLATISLFASIGVTHTKATETARNTRNAASLKEIIDRNELTTKELDEKQGDLVLHLAVQGTKIGPDERDYVAKAIVDGRLKTNDQVTGMLSTFYSSGLFLNLLQNIASVKYLENYPLPVDEKQFDLQCGVGMYRIWACFTIGSKI